jgi:hypothetical protein
VPRLARAIAEEGTFAHLPVLADALEEAGCTDERLLGHLRGQAEHWPGCWAVELLAWPPKNSGEESSWNPSQSRSTPSE